MRSLLNKNPYPENFERYLILRNKSVKLRLSSQRKYFEQRCKGGPKNQSTLNISGPQSNHL